MSKNDASRTSLRSTISVAGDEGAISSAVDGSCSDERLDMGLDNCLAVKRFFRKI